MNLGASSVSSNVGAAANSGETSAANLRDRFVEYKNEIRYVSLRIACWLVIALMPAGMLLDWYVYPEKLWFFAVMRVICSAFTLVVWAFLGTPGGRRYHAPLGMVLFLLPNLLMSLMIYFTEGARSPYYAGLNVMVMGFSWVAQVNFLEGITASLITVLMYCAACIAHGGGTSAEYFNNLYFITLTAITSNTGGYVLDRLRFREFALRLQLDSSRLELEQSNAKLVELDRAKSSFFANVSHELRTPLTLLIGPLERLRRRPAPASHEQVEMLDIMYNNAMRLLRLINDLLDLVRLDSGAIRVHRERVEVVSFLTGIAKSVSHMALQRGLHFDTCIEIDKAACVWIDRDKVEKIILNLLFNAFKFTPEAGAVTLEAALKDGNLVLAVRDTGKGIADADLPRIFDRFWQAESASTRKYQGVGVGLALVKELTEAHGGTVSAESKMDKGTTMRITLPIVEKGECDDAPAAAANAPSSPEQNEWLAQLYRRAELFPAHVVGKDVTPVDADDSGEGKPHVLVADDEPEMRRFLNSQLKEAYSVHEARNGSQALDMARTKSFSLILLDWMMPGIDGITLARQLREEPRTAGVPIVILTARADEDSKLQALEAGATDFLTKPFASSELFARCRNLMIQRELQQSLKRKTQELEAALEQIKATEAQLVHQAKMASLGQLSAGLMHEINNPLNFANTASHLLLKRLKNISFEDHELVSAPLRDLQDGIRRVSDIIGNLRSFIHPDTSNFGNVSLREVIETSARFVQIDPSEIALEIAVADDLKVWGNQNQLIHLVINLLQNASDSLREKGAPEKKIKMEACLQNGRILLTCEDNGKGIKSEDQGRIFDAFYTTKPVGSGMGLGLSICYRIVQNHSGSMSVESRENEFCRFAITLNPTKAA